MALIKCPECGREVSDQAVACPECGYPIRKVEYTFATVGYRISTGYYDGMREYNALLKEGWRVIDERTEELFDFDGVLYGWRTHYKLQR